VSFGSVHVWGSRAEDLSQGTRRSCTFGKPSLWVQDVRVVSTDVVGTVSVECFASS
jgi:hypothetical protein